MESVTGTVDSVVYSADATGYAVLRVTADDGSAVTVVGCIPRPIPGETIAAEGRWTVHHSFGKQFEITGLKRELPASAGAMLNYLKSGTLPGVGSVTAKLLLDKFGADILGIIETDPEKLTTVKGISKKRALDIGHAFSEQNIVRRLIEFLSAHKLPPNHALNLYKHYGSDAMARLRENPYILVSFDLTFEMADTLAFDLGIAPDSFVRQKAGVLYELRYNLDQGHCYIPFDKLCAVTGALLSLDGVNIADAIDALTEEGLIVRERVGGRDACYLAEIYDAECYIAERALYLAAKAPAAPKRLLEQIESVEHGMELTLERQQRQAVSVAAKSSLFVLTGGPGTGKTTTVRAIVTLFERLGLKVGLAAPTGRAAKRLSDVTGRDAATIHRFLGFAPDGDTGGFSFYHTADTPLPHDAVIVDETSMVDVPLMGALMEALRDDARLILVGDADQLPAVGPGSVLNDLLLCDRLDSVRLTEIFRQAADSRIVTGAHAVNAGQLPDLSNRGDLFCLGRLDADDAVSTIAELVLKRLPENMGIAPERIQVLTPTRLGTCGTRSLNEVLQQALNPPSPEKNEHRLGHTVFREDDRVMQIKNNYELMWTTESGDAGIGVFNGDTGRLASVDRQTERAVVRYDDGHIISYPFERLFELELAYAMTVHKAQGSEYPAVIFAHMPCAKTLMTRRVLYTAMTRARDLLVMVGDKRVLGEMVKSGKKIARYSGLSERLQKVSGVNEDLH
ncbi:MAG: ATP-dependent RecD-like DNA helicase [Oscillospiraceae bacterium]|nr:ATP-dependent RecD-like DNA helicase [Oscillospiraceae bacterium]